MSGALCGIFTTTWDLVAQTTRNTGGIGGIGGGTVMQVAKRLFVLATTTSGRRGNSLWIVPLVTGGLVNGAMFSTYEGKHTYIQYTSTNTYTHKQTHTHIHAHIHPYTQSQSMALVLRMQWQSLRKRNFKETKTKTVI